MAAGGIIAFLLVCVLGTSFLSGVLSLGGGTLLMGIFAWLMPVSVAMMLHGVTQFTSNFSRWWLYRANTQWTLLKGYFIGAGLCLVAFSWIAFLPGKIALFLVLGLLPFVNFLVPREYTLSVTMRGLRHCQHGVPFDRRSFGADPGCVLRQFRADPTTDHCHQGLYPDHRASVEDNLFRNIFGPRRRCHRAFAFVGIRRRRTAGVPRRLGSAAYR